MAPMRLAATHRASFPEHNPNPVVEVDVEGRVRYANPAALALFPDLIAQALAHPWLADWPAAVTRMQQPAQHNTDRRIVVVGACSYDQTLRLMPEEGTVRIYGLDITNRVQAETAARQAHARTSAILESIADAFYSLDAEWRFVVVNPAAERAPFGRPASELLGRVIWEVFPKIPGTRIHQHYLDAVAERSQEHYEAPSPLNGRWYDVFMFPRSGGLDVYLRDIDDRKKAEAALKASEERFRTLASNAQDSIARFDRAGRYVYVNPYVADRMGLPAEAIVGKTAEDLGRNLGTEKWEERLQEAFQFGKPQRFDRRSVDGRWYDVQIMPELRDGEVETVLAISRDISDRKRLERLYAVLSQVNEAIVRDHDETTLYREVCRIVAEEGDFPLAWIGMVEGQVIVPVASGGKETAYLSQIHVAVDGELGSGPTGTCVRENRPVVNDDFVVNPSTSPWRGPALGHGFRASAAFPLHRHGKTIGALTLYAGRIGVFDSAERKLLEALCADLSYAIVAMEHERERTQAEESLRAANAQLLAADQHKNEFLAVLSHELRNPLAPIRNSLFVLDRADPNSEQAKRAREIVGRQTAQMARLVDDLLDVTRISHNKIQLQRVPLDLNDLVRRTVDDHRFLFEGKGIVVETSFAGQVLPVDGDRARLAQIVGNLLQNAAKYTPMGQKVKVETKAVPTRRRAGIRIIDTGVGIEPAVLRRLFQPFMQASATLDRSQGGLGLGLALVKGLVELHGGEVCAHSEGPGKGAEFIVELPLEEATQGKTSPGAEASTTRRKRILIVEDNLDAAQSLREVLEFGEHLVEVAHSGPEGLDKARQFSPEVVLCDIGLPGMDGYGVARALRADEALKRVFLVALSGYALPEDLQRASEPGFDRHVAKPPSLEKLEDLLRDLAPRADPSSDS